MNLPLMLAMILRFVLETLALPAPPTVALPRRQSKSLRRKRGMIRLDPGMPLVDQARQHGAR